MTITTPVADRIGFVHSKEVRRWLAERWIFRADYQGVKNQKLRQLADDDFSPLNLFMTLCIANVITMATESYGMPNEQQRNIRVANVVSPSYSLETAFKLCVAGEYLECGRSIVIPLIWLLLYYRQLYSKEALLQPARYDYAALAVQLEYFEWDGFKQVEASCASNGIDEEINFTDLADVASFIAISIHGIHFSDETFGNIAREDNLGFRTLDKA